MARHDPATSGTAMEITLCSHLLIPEDECLVAFKDGVCCYRNVTVSALGSLTRRTPICELVHLQDVSAPCTNTLGLSTVNVVLQAHGQQTHIHRGLVQHNRSLALLVSIGSSKYDHLRDNTVQDLVSISLPCFANL